MGYSVIITGATGMVGKGVLLECLESEYISRVLSVSRSSLQMEHPKLQELILPDFMKIGSYRHELENFDACFFCMGVSSVGMNETRYTQLTFETAKAFADVLHELNPSMTFNYVSGTGTDSSGQGRIMWARVKGVTENMILTKGFADAYAFRPGLILPEKGIKSKTAWYQAAYVLLKPFFPLMKKSESVTTTTRIGLAMINTLRNPLQLKHLENKDINRLAKL